MRRDEKGLTLIELIVGLALLGLFMAGVYAVAVGTVQAKRRIDRAAAVYTAGPAILDIIESDLRGAYVFGVKDNLSFKAQRQGVGGEEVTILDFITTTNSKVEQEIDRRMVRSDLTEVGYRLRQSDEWPDVLELYRREQFFFDDDLIRGGDYHLVYDRVRSLTINFFEDPEAGGITSSLTSEEGKESWDSEDEGGLPYAAKVTLNLAPPQEMEQDLSESETYYTFTRFVLLPTAYDRLPEEDGGEGNGGGGGEDDSGPR